MSCSRCLCSTACARRGGGDSEAGQTERLHLPAKRRQHCRIPNAHVGAALKAVEALLSLEMHRQIITPISGMHHPYVLGQYHNCSTIWLTGGKIGPSERNTISGDQLMAQVTVPQIRFSSIELSNQGHSLAYNGEEEFKPLLVQDTDRFAEAFVEQLATYSLRRVMTFDDSAQIKAVTEASKKEDYKLGTIIENLVLSDLFQKR